MGDITMMDVGQRGMEDKRRKEIGGIENTGAKKRAEQLEK